MTDRSSHGVAVDIVATARRVEQRVDLATQVSLHLGSGEALPATLTDLTTRGCRLTVGRSVPEGMHVTVVARSTMVGGAVAWSTDGAAGVEFGARLMPKAVRALSA